MDSSHTEHDDIAMREAEADSNNKTDVPEKQIRPIFLRLGVVEDYKGSAYMEYGATKVIAIIERPREGQVTQTKETEEQNTVNCVVKYTPITVEDALVLQQKEEELTLALKKAITSSIHKQKFGNHLVNIKATILDDDGCALSTAINCCGVALTVAGIPTYDIIAASTIGFSKGEIIFNPDVAFEKKLSGKRLKRSAARDQEEFGMVITATLPTFDAISYSFQKGLMKQATLEKLIQHTFKLNSLISETLKAVYIMKIKETLAQSEAQPQSESENP